MQFLADVFVPCEVCEDKRFKPQVLEVQYRGRSVDQVLDMTVREAMTWMRTQPATDIRAAMPAERHVPDAEAELLAIRQAQETLSPDGAMSLEAAERIRSYVATFSDRPRIMAVDVTRTYTNAFLTP